MYIINEKQLINLPERVEYIRIKDCFYLICTPDHGIGMIGTLLIDGRSAYSLTNDVDQILMAIKNKKGRMFNCLKLCGIDNEEMDQYKKRYKREEILNNQELGKIIIHMGSIIDE